MEIWSSLSGAVKGVIVVGILVAICLGVYNGLSRPSAEDERANQAKRSVR